MKELYSKKYIADDGSEKTVRVLMGDITADTDGFDMLIISAFKGDYLPVRRSLIGALKRECGINVQELSERSPLDLRQKGFWVSEELTGKIRRIGCVEMADLRNRNDRTADSAVRSHAFASLRMLLDAAEMLEYPMGRVGVPLIGTGCQGMETEFIASSLVAMGIDMLSSCQGMRELVFFELDPVKSECLVRAARGVLEQTVAETDGDSPSCFISYSTKQTEVAFSIYRYLTEKGVRCWIAPDCIPAGSNYLEEIPVAISTSDALALILTDDAQRSVWVGKEVECAINAGKLLLPFQIEKCELTPKFRFALACEQIAPLWEYGAEELAERLFAIFEKRINERR